MKHCLLLLFISLAGFGQSLRLDQGSRYNHFIDRMDIVYRNVQGYTTSIKNYDSKALAEWVFAHLDELKGLDKIEALHFLNQYNYYKFYAKELYNSKTYVDSAFYFLEEGTHDDVKVYKEQKPLLKYFYQSPHHLYSLHSEGLNLRINPIIDIGSGYAQDDTSTIFRNTRGLRVNGYIDDKIYFHTEIIENQAQFNNYVEDFVDSYKAIPGNGLYKDYKSSILKSLQGHDFLNARGYVGVPISKSVSVELGHSNHFIGNGMRSLLLSDFSNNYFYLKFNTRVWRIHYQNLFAELNAATPNLQGGDGLVPKKYMANHYLTIDLGKKVELGLFETVIFSRENQFELQYLNPIILYRFVEHALGSPDNVILGTNIKWNPIKNISIYGQLALDELNFALFNQSDWWANKYALQLGGKYFNIFGISQLDGQAEINIVRPYTYSHNKEIETIPQNSVANYSHMHMSLAHPLGANFRELLFKLNYKPSARLRIQATIHYAQKGLDINEENFGGNILTVNSSRISEYGINLLQGDLTTIKAGYVNIQYELFKNYFIDANIISRNATSNSGFNDKKTLFLGLGFRANISPSEHIF